MQRPVPNPGILDIAPYVGGKSSAQHASNVLGRVIKLSSNESPLGPSPQAIAAYQAEANTLHRYPDGSHTKLRDAIALAYGLDANRIVCGAGSDELIGLLINAYAQPGDNIVMSRHGFLMYQIYAQAAGVETRMADEKHYTTDVDAMLAAVTPRTKLVFLANPNNPTGSYISAQELARLHTGLPQHVLLVVDGAYAEYVEAEDYSAGLDLALSTQNTVMLRTFSKIYGLPALRIGWGLFPPEVADVLNRVRGPFNLSSPALAAGTAAVADQAHVARAVAHNTQWLAWLTQEIGALSWPVLPSVGNFLLAECDAPRIAAQLAERGILTREVKAYGLPRHLRISVGLEEENKALMSALKEIPA